MADPAAIRDLLDKMASERDALLGQAEAFTDAEAQRAPRDAAGEAGWTVKEQLGHLAEMETAYRAWVERALDEDGADLTGVAGQPPAIRLDQANRHPVSELTAELRRQRAMTLAVIERMRPEDYDRTASQPMFGRLTVLQWLRSFYRHDRMHQAQMAGREPEYKPRFAGGVEPDQRRGTRI